MAEVLHFERDNACLRQGESEIALTPKAMAVVEYLVGNAGKISTKNDLLDTVWADEAVSEYALTSIIRDLRRALGDSTKNPRYIETVHRRGYRWIGEVSAVVPPSVAAEQVKPVVKDSTSVTLPSQIDSASVTPEAASIATIAFAEKPNRHFTGRTQELDQLLQYQQLAAQGQRQLVFLTGEAGIGKTTLLEELTDRLIHTPNCSITLGQCIEKYGAGEAYRPMLEALNRFCLTAEGQQFIDILEQYAPSWLMQMPTLLTPAQLSRLQQRGIAPKERWLRELAEALEVITRDRLLVIILEDLHWSDPSTVELLAMLARRQESARLFILASYRPAEVNQSDHPLKPMKQALQLHSQCAEIALNDLDQAAIEHYLVQRFPHQFAPHPPSQPSVSQEHPSSQVAAEIYQRTEGNPLFVVNVVESLIEQRANSSESRYLNIEKLSSTGVPNNLQQLINLQFEALNAEQQQILETASVEGAEFLSVTVAANLQMESEQVELCIDDLVQLKHLITIDDVEILPDGSLSTRYRFIHALYQEGLYQRLTKNRRVRLHRTLGAKLETIYGIEVSEIATQLALHFEQGMDYAKAISYRQQAGENALQRNAHEAAVEHFQSGLALLTTIKAVTVRASLELPLQTNLGTALMTLKGQAAAEVGLAYGRAEELCRSSYDCNIAEQFGVNFGLWRHIFIGGNLQKSLVLGQECFALAERAQDATLLGHAHYALAGTLMYQGELTQALAHADSGLAAYDHLTRSTEEALHHSQAPNATLMAYRAWILFFMGYWDQAVQAMSEMLALDIVRSHPQTTVTSLTYSGILYMYLGEYDQAQQQLKEAIQLAQVWHIPQFATIAQFFLTCTLCRAEHNASRLPEMQQMLAIRRAAGAELHATGYLNRIAEGYLLTQQPEASFAILTEVASILTQNNERIFEADSDRLRGELWLLPGSHRNEAQAEILFQQALDIAQNQQAKTFALRSATRLARLWREQGKIDAARALLTPIYESFTEGFQFLDLQNAKHLLMEL
ncbi:AAA family ATPase [filamentous cyanobacterium LEGE 11480]|uniref:AAA family ATPase n=1 Tax=Romeriopsis navalis LEGE 11480 TaxID=2777977 RepID=A0A928VL69_9CYAN|nr:AAA family ATPase [Romeriopsis navalis]MBE9030345.1 AAA family ATPase [Romeriopsis navalis LEGE 11480]